MLAQYDLTVVLVSYNTKSLLHAALARLVGTEWLTLIVVDNASKDGSAAATAAQFPSVELVRNEVNVGFARAANQGIARARTPFIVLLNPDTEASPDLLRTLVSYLQQHEEVWAVAPRLIDSSGHPQTMAAGFAPTPSRAFLYFLGASYLLPWPSVGFAAPPRVNRPIEVDWLSGACLSFRRSVVDRVGPLDGSYFLYGEDMDWCRRIKASGGKLMFLADLDLRHTRAASSGHDVVSTDWLIGLDRYVRPLMSPLGVKLFFSAAAIGFWLRGFRSMVPGRGQPRSTLWGYAGAAVRLALRPVNRRARTSRGAREDRG
jgi:GT2 family glycosyltransferase